MTFEKALPSSRGLSPLVAGLHDAAQESLDSAVRAFASQSHRQFYIEAGATLELLSKFYLAQLNPLLLLLPQSKGWDGEAKRLLSGEALRPGVGLRTVGASEAIDRLQVIDPRPAVLSAWCKQVFEARNDVVHAGLVHPDSHRSHLVLAAAFFKAVLMLRSARRADSSLGTEVDDLITTWDFTIFRSHAGLVKDVVAKDVDSERLAAQRLVAAARARHESNRDSPSSVAVAAAIEAMLAPLTGMFRVRWSCIACGSLGLASGSLEVIDVAPRDHGDGDDGEREVLILIYEDVECHVCGLQLNGHQLHLLGEPNAAEHPTAGPSDAYYLDTEWFEPDDDRRLHVLDPNVEGFEPDG